MASIGRLLVNNMAILRPAFRLFHSHNPSPPPSPSHFSLPPHHRVGMARLERRRFSRRLLAGRELTKHLLPKRLVPSSIEALPPPPAGSEPRDAVLEACLVIANGRGWRKKTCGRERGRGWRGLVDWAAAAAATCLAEACRCGAIASEVLLVVILARDFVSDVSLQTEDWAG